MLISKEFKFDAAHHLDGYKGKCEKVHGHTYKLRVTIKSDVGEDGMAFDFAKLKKIVEERVIEKLDHTDLNELLKQPTAENIAIWIWQELDELPLSEIRVWETDSSFVTYKGSRE